MVDVYISDVTLMNLCKLTVNSYGIIVCDVNWNVVHIEMYRFIAVVCKCISYVNLRLNGYTKEVLYCLMIVY